MRGPSFVGTVIDIENPPKEWRNPDQGGLSRYRFRVDENISGFDQKEVDVYSGRGFADCSYHFRKGVSYLVKRYTIPGDERLMTNICNGTDAAANAKALIELLRARRDAINNSNISEASRPYSRTFYPNAAGFKTAQPITIGEDEQIGGPQEVLNADIHVLPSVKQGAAPKN